MTRYEDEHDRIRRDHLPIKLRDTYTLARALERVQLEHELTLGETQDTVARCLEGVERALEARNPTHARHLADELAEALRAEQGDLYALTGEDNSPDDQLAEWLAGDLVTAPDLGAIAGAVAELRRTREW